jgi:hypothetical protein
MAIKDFIEKHKAEIVSTGAAITIAGSTLASQALMYSADDTTDALNATFIMLGGMMDGFATLVPHIINLIVAFIPLAVLGAVLGAVMLLIYEVPKYVKIGKKGV